MRQILTVVLLFTLCTSYSQTIELGFWGGGATYNGDFSPDNIPDYFNEINPAGGIFFRANPVNMLSLRLGISLGKIDGRDGDNNTFGERDLNFRTNITEFAFTAEVNLFRLGDKRGTQFAPYLFGGASLFRFNPEAEFEGNYIELQPLGTEGQGLPTYEEPYSLSAFSIPMGGGVKFIFKEKFTLGIELGARKTFTDYLDDVSNTEVNYLEVLLGNGELAADLSNPSLRDTPDQNVNYRRGGEFDDWYVFGGVTFSFAFGEGGGGGISGKGWGCPTF